MSNSYFLFYIAPEFENKIIPGLEPHECTWNDSFREQHEPAVNHDLDKHCNKLSSQNENNW